MKEIYVFLFDEDGRQLHDDGLIVPGLGDVPRMGDCIVAEASRNKSNPSKQTIYEIVRR